MREHVIRGLLLICGTLSVILGVIGIFIPVLPTTPFLVMAAFCYMRSSERFYHRLINHRILGRYLKNYWEGKGIPLRDKLFTLILLWLTIGFSAAYVVTIWWGRLILLSVAIGVTIHLIIIKTLKTGDDLPEQQTKPVAKSEQDVV